MSFYSKFISNGQKGFSLKGGSFARWRYPLSKVLYRKRLIVGPEKERPRSAWSNWNYNSELYAFGKRLNENFSETLLRQAFTDPSYNISEIEKLRELGLDLEQSVSNNLELSREGENICKYYLRAILNFWHPKFPEEGIEAVVDYLTKREHLVYVAKNIGIVDLIKTEEFPLDDDTQEAALFSVIAALSRSSGPVKAHFFINDFILTQLIGKDINEIWEINDPMGLLCEELKKSGSKSMPVPRLLWSTGVTTPTSAYIVGLYVDKEFLSKGGGETIDIAEEMAARDALRRIYGTTEDAAPVPYGEKARKFSEAINSIYTALTKKELVDKN